MTFMAIYNLLKIVWGNSTLRYIAIGIVVLLTLVFGWFKLTGHYYSTGYDAGITFQTRKYEKEQADLKQQYDNKLKTANDDRTKLNDELKTQKTDYANLLLSRQTKETVTTNEVIKYVQTPNGSKRSLDAEWLRIYTNSLPE